MSKIESMMNPKDLNICIKQIAVFIRPFLGRMLAIAIISTNIKSLRGYK